MRCSPTQTKASLKVSELHK